MIFWRSLHILVQYTLIIARCRSAGKLGSYPSCSVQRQWSGEASGAADEEADPSPHVHSGAVPAHVVGSDRAGHWVVGEMGWRSLGGGRGDGVKQVMRDV